MRLTVTPHPIGKKLHRLDIYADGRYIGEYERAQAADISPKRPEVRSFCSGSTPSTANSGFGGVGNDAR